MNLGELLQLLRESILNDRTDRIGGTSDYLWSDQTLVTYINEAQRRFAVQGLVLRDSVTDEVTKVTLVPGQTIYPLHESVIAVLSVKNESQQADLNRVGHAMLGAYRAPSDSWTDPASVTNLPAGPSLAYSTDEGISNDGSDQTAQVTLRVYPAPAEVATLRLRVIRKPLEKFVVNAPSQQAEIPEDHHIEMLDWAAYLALRVVDDDAGSAKRALDFKATFDQHVSEARKLVMQKLFAPMQWGFGRGGWGWGS
jgi:hypothetical protein